MKDNLIKKLKEKYSIDRELTETELNIVDCTLDIIQSLHNVVLDMEKKIIFLEIDIENKKIIIEDMISDNNDFNDKNGYGL